MSSPQHEPTMEEILASIRKIISEDAPADAPAAANAAPQPEPDVLELTQEVVETRAPAPPPPPAPAPVDEVIFQPEPAPAGSDIFSDRTRKAMDDTFANIPDEEPEPTPMARSAPAPMPAVDGNSVESVFERAVRESFEPVLQKYLSDNSAAIIDRMKPAIREWMDEHFPELLDNAVRAEVERVVRARKK